MQSWPLLSQLQGPAGKNYSFPGVKPKCLQGRWLETKLNVTRDVLTINIDEYFWDKESTQVCCVTVPDCLKERIIGRLICVACHDDIYIVQYITEKCKYVRFLSIDGRNSSVHCFKEAERYFRKDFAAFSPIECLLAPGRTKALFRLPQPIMSSRKWSKMLSANITLGLDGVRVGDIISDGLRDRRNQGVAFNPLRSGQVTFVLLDEYCKNCTLAQFNINSKERSSRERKVSLNPSTVSRVAGGSSEADDSEADDDSLTDEPAYYFLQQCNIDFCRDGEILALCCVVRAHDRLQYFIRLILFSNKLELLKVEQHSLEQLQVNWDKTIPHL